MERPATRMPWPMPGISWKVQPRTLPKNAIASAGLGVRMLIQQKSPALRMPVAIENPLGFG